MPLRSSEKSNGRTSAGMPDRGYSHWMDVDGELWAYAGVARPNESSEVRLFRLQK
jgi:hypothetical protein